MDRERGSAQIIEMAFILPFVFSVVTGLVYLCFFMFSYVLSTNMVSYSGELIAEKAGSDKLYWFIDQGIISEKELKSTVEEMTDKVNLLEVLPGTTLEYKVSVESKNMRTYVESEIECCYYKKRVYLVQDEREIVKPAEFASAIDALLELSGVLEFSDLGEEGISELKKMCNEIFKWN